MNNKYTPKGCEKVKQGEAAMTKFKQTEIGLIPEDWEVVTIPYVSSNFDNKRKPLSSRVRAKMKGEYPYYGAAGIIGYVNEFKYEGNYLLIAEDGTVTSDGSKPMLQLPKGRFWVSNHAHVLQCEYYEDTLFLYYQLKNTTITPFITGAVQPKLSQKNLNKIKFAWTKNIYERRAIAKILSSLDDKIELLRNQNKTLEAIGQALFKHWFVDFEFPDEEGKPYKSSGGELVYNEELEKEIPKGWEVDKMKNLSDVNWGDTNVTKRSYIKEGFLAYSASGPDGFRDKFDYEREGIVLSAIGAYCGKTWYAQGKWSCIKNTIRIFGEKIPTSYLYFLTKKNSFWQIRGAAQPFISKGDIDNTQILVPPLNLLKKFDIMSKNIFDRIFITNQEIQTLSKTRDSLLPKLMSGKIRVPLEVRK